MTTDREQALPPRRWPFRRDRPPGAALALQGGGAHGAFARGVVEALLEARALRPLGLSGASAGALNAVAVASGWAAGGREGAQRALERLWDGIAAGGEGGPLALLGSLRARILRELPRLGSPYQLNPAGLNPIRELILRTIDLEPLRHPRAPRVLVSATNVHSGDTRLFNNASITVEALLASTCLPFMFQAVEIAGEFYWDGGYSSNPPLLALARHARARDVILVQLTRRRREALPRDNAAIADRIRELGFNAGINRELETLALLPAWRRLGLPRWHRIDADDHLEGLPTDTSLDTGRRFLEALRQAGQRHADAWLASDGRHLGRRSGMAVGRPAPANRG